MKFLLFTSILVVLTLRCFGQFSSAELSLIKNQNFDEPQYNRRVATYLFKNNKNVLVKYNPVSLTFGGLLYFYQKAISPQIAVNCPYEINCSNFGKQCIQHFGLLKGLALTADRLTRCTQYTMIDLKPINVNSQKKIIDSLDFYKTSHRHN